MKRLQLTLLALSFLTGSAIADRFVATNGPHLSPFDDWSKAATNIQAAIDVATAGETVWVSNGTYVSAVTLAIDKGITLQGMGPDKTTIAALSYSAPPVSSTNRLVRVSHLDAVLSGFTVRGSGIGGLYINKGTVTNCWIRSNRLASHWQDGAGISQAGGLVTDSVIGWNTNVAGNNCRGAGIYTTGGTISDSLICSNAAPYYAGGAGIYMAGVTLVRNCLIIGNTSTDKRIGVAHGGGVRMAAAGSLVNCTVAGNLCAAEAKGGGIYKTSGSMTNVIVYGNRRGSWPSDLEGTDKVYYSCAPELTTGVNGNTKADPLFMNTEQGNYRLNVGSPCIDTGTNAPWMGGNQPDMDDQPRLTDGNGDTTTNVDMGCFEAGVFSNGPFRVNFSVVPATGYLSIDPVFIVSAGGTNTSIIHYAWDFNNDRTNDSSGPGLGTVTQNFNTGFYSVKLTVTNSDLETASHISSNCVQVYPTTYYVATNGTPTTPYDTWAKAAPDIATVVDYALADGATGVVVHVSNGVYTAGNYILINKSMAISSVHGPTSTTLRTSSGKIVQIIDPGASLSGFTLTGGLYGGFYMLDGTISNCWVVGNRMNSYQAVGAGGMVLGGLLTHCVISGNTNKYDTGSNGGGLDVTGGSIFNSTICSNYARGNGGGIYLHGIATVRNCLIANNTSVVNGGGVGLVANASIESCTIVDNVCSNTADGGGIYKTAGSMTNAVVYGNMKGAVAQDLAGSAATNKVYYSCAPELTPGVNGNLNANPLFRNHALSDYSLDSDSPCIDKGTNMPWMADAMDLEGNPRVVCGWVDMGAYEATAPGMVFTIM